MNSGGRSEYERARGEELVSAYVDGELSAEEREELEARLASDEQLSSVLRDVSEIRRAVRSMPWKEPPAGTLDEIVAAVRDTDPSPVGERTAPVAELDTRRRRTRWVSAVAGGAVAAALVVAFALPSRDDATPRLGELSDAHLAESALTDPISRVAPIAVPASFEP